LEERKAEAEYEFTRVEAEYGEKTDGGAGGGRRRRWSR